MGCPPWTCPRSGSVQWPLAVAERRILKDNLSPVFDRSHSGLDSCEGSVKRTFHRTLNMMDSLCSHRLYFCAHVLRWELLLFLFYISLRLDSPLHVWILIARSALPAPFLAHWIRGSERRKTLRCYLARLVSKKLHRSILILQPNGLVALEHRLLLYYFQGV